MMALAQNTIWNSASATAFLTARSGQILRSQLLVEFQVKLSHYFIRWRRIWRSHLWQEGVEANIVNEGFKSNIIVRTTG